MEGDSVYAGFACVYDRLMSDVPYARWADRIDAMIREYGISKRGTDGDDPKDNDAQLAEERNLVVDLCCGTGTLTGLLADRGYDMMGVDLSPEMLSEAQRKNADRERPIPYICQDMRELDLYCTAGTVISLCDSINYLTKRSEPERVFRLVNRFLYPGGLFLFDFHTKHYYRDVLGTRLIGETGQEISYLWDNTWSEKRSLNRMDLTFFVREDGAQTAYQRFEETHIQRGYTLSEMKTFVARSGMRFLTALDMDTGRKPHARSERILVAAGENGKEG